MSSPEGGFAIPLRVLHHRADGPRLDELRELVIEHRADGLVIGLPLSLSGSPSQQTHAVVALARRIAACFGVPLEAPGTEFALSPDTAGSQPLEHREGEAGGRPRVLLWDERLTSWEAARLATPEGGRGKRRREAQDLDAHAAAVILQSFLDSRAPGLEGNEAGAAG